MSHPPSRLSVSISTAHPPPPVFFPRIIVVTFPSLLLYATARDAIGVAPDRWNHSYYLYSPGLRRPSFRGSPRFFETLLCDKDLKHLLPDIIKFDVRGKMIQVQRGEVFEGAK